MSTSPIYVSLKGINFGMAPSLPCHKQGWTLERLTLTPRLVEKSLLLRCLNPLYVLLLAFTNKGQTSWWGVTCRQANMLTSIGYTLHMPWHRTWGLPVQLHSTVCWKTVGGKRNCDIGELVPIPSAQSAIGSKMQSGNLQVCSPMLKTQTVSWDTLAVSLLTADATGSYEKGRRMIVISWSWSRILWIELSSDCQDLQKVLCPRLSTKSQDRNANWLPALHMGEEFLSTSQIQNNHLGQTGTLKCCPGPCRHAGTCLKRPVNPGPEYANCSLTIHPRPSGCKLIHLQCEHDTLPVWLC